jgi:hypothetical protein
MTLLLQIYIYLVFISSSPVEASSNVAVKWTEPWALKIND